MFLSPCLSEILHFSHDRYKWSSPSFSSTTFQNFPGISDLPSEVFTFQHHTKLYSKCSISAIQFTGETSLLLVECCFCQGNPGCNSTCTACTICCNATQIASIQFVIDDQSDATFGLLICNQSALHVSGDVFAHHQEHLTVFTASDIVVHLCCCRPV